MHLEGKSTEQIITSGQFRKSKGNEVHLSYGVDVDGKEITELKDPKEQSDTLRDLLKPARRWVLIAADGYFAKHPKGKKYFGEK